MKRIALASLVALASTLPALSHAADGTIKFEGKISATTCKINGLDPAGSNTTTVEFAPSKPADFATNGSPANGAAMKPIVLQLSECALDATNPDPKVSIKFDELSSLADATYGGLRNLSGKGYAKNVQVNIYDSNAAGDAAAAKIMLGRPQASANEFPIDKVTNTATMKYFAQLVRQDTDGTGVTGGIFNSSIRYWLNYE